MRMKRKNPDGVFSLISSLKKSEKALIGLSAIETKANLFILNSLTLKDFFFPTDTDYIKISSAEEKEKPDKHFYCLSRNHVDNLNV